MPSDPFYVSNITRQFSFCNASFPLLWGASKPQEMCMPHRREPPSTFPVFLRGRHRPPNSPGYRGPRPRGSPRHDLCILFRVLHVQITEMTKPSATNVRCFPMSAVKYMVTAWQDLCILFQTQNWQLGDGVRQSYDSTLCDSSKIEHNTYISMNWRRQVEHNFFKKESLLI